MCRKRLRSILVCGIIKERRRCVDKIYYGTYQHSKFILLRRFYVNEITIFKHEEFGQVRALMIDDEPWFIGKDVAIALGYSNASKAVSTHIDDEDKTFVMLDMADSQNGNVPIGKTKTAMINESGLYSLIMSSKLPSAKKFKRWVTSEVLPSIRKTGSYSVNTDPMLALPQDYSSALRALADEHDARMKLEAKVEEDAPKVDYHDRVLDTKDSYPVGLIAKEFGKSARWMNKYLAEKGIQYKQSGRWILYQDYADFGYAKYNTVLYEDSKGKEHSAMYMKWTQLGRKFIHQLMTDDGYEMLEDLSDADRSEFEDIIE